MKGAWPVEAMAVGGRHYRGDSLDQNFDVYSVEYTFPDGTKLFYDGRNMNGCHNEFASYAHGSKGSAVITTLSHTPGMVRIYKGQRMPRVLSTQDLPLAYDPNLAWAYPQPEKSPYDWEWDDLTGGHSREQALQRGAARSGSQPGGVYGPHVRAHRPDHYIRADAELAARIRTGCGQVDDGWSRAAAAGTRRQVSSA